MGQVVGFVGLGTMGLPMALNLLKAGYSVNGYDRNEAALASFAEKGGVIKHSASELEADVVITMLPTGAHVAEAVIGPQGVLESDVLPSIVVNMSSILPAETESIAESVIGSGLSFVDAPVGRSFAHAWKGTLLIMAGGSENDITKVQPIFDVLGDKTVHCGPIGAGSRMKLVNNYVSMALNALTAEGILLAEASGLDVKTALDVMRGTSAGAGHMTATYPTRVLRGNLKPGFSVQLAHKDLKLALKMAKAINVPLDIGVAAETIYAAAEEAGHAASDFTALYLVLRDQAGLAPYQPLLAETEEVPQ